MRIWTVSERKAGTLTQCLGVSRPIDPVPHRVIIEKKLPRWRKGILSPYRNLEGPEPDIIVSCGSMSPSHVLAIATACRKRPFTVHLQTPQLKFSKFYDLAFIPRHDWTEEKAKSPNFRPMLGAPHQFTPAALEGARPSAREKWGNGAQKMLAVLVGGPNGAYHFDRPTLEHLVESIRGLAGEGWRLLISTSRRSPPSLLSQLLDLRSDNVVVWDNTGHNPYSEFLAAADAFLITKDTITMTCEALTTGRPVYIFDLAKTPCKKLDEFEWFHTDMGKTHGLTRPFEGSIEPYSYTPPNEAQRIADLISEMSSRNRGPASKRL
ncbi:mitochondrial fission ELM1 family protein [Mesorhizobium sp. ASY16-5R]|uniref:mitochondrial fission ELM1 family protein n=1 Tax=Mesorhizobium sp. ASY16-5R TaxID=3445772 RepID=UPI003FA16033